MQHIFHTRIMIHQIKLTVFAKMQFVYFALDQPTCVCAPKLCTKDNLDIDFGFILKNSKCNNSTNNIILHF